VRHSYDGWRVLNVLTALVLFATFDWRCCLANYSVAALVAHPAQHFTTRLAQVHALLPNLENIAQEPVDDACHSLPPAVLRVDAQRWTDQLCVTGANLIRHVTRIVRARQGLCLTRVKWCVTDLHFDRCQPLCAGAEFDGAELAATRVRTARAHWTGTTLIQIWKGLQGPVQRRSVFIGSHVARDSRPGREYCSRRVVE
jgi:hypothetical protein